MKILHLNTYDGNGGAGRAAWRLHEALLGAGEESRLAVNMKFGSKSEISTFSPDKLSRAYSMFCIVSEQLLVKEKTKPLRIPYSIPFFGRDISNHKWVREADIIHLHWINHGFLTMKTLKSLFLTKKPIVWTFHDSYPYTGGCHVRYTCEGFKNTCGNCPVLKASTEHDLSRKNWIKKSEVYPLNPFSVVAPSSWKASSVASSPLLEGHPLVRIPNALNTVLFSPQDKKKARERLGVPLNKKVILSGIMPSRLDKHKGTSYLFESLDILAKSPLEEELFLLVFGNKKPIENTGISIPMKSLGVIAEEEQLALIYAAADVFVTASLEDNLPNTVMESLSCGTPVVSFKTGGIPDLINHMQNGYLAEYKSSADLAKGISWILERSETREISGKARQSVLDNYTYANVAKQHIELYTQILSTNTSGQ